MFSYSGDQFSFLLPAGKHSTGRSRRKEYGTDSSRDSAAKGIEGITPRKTLTVRATKEDGQEMAFEAIARLDTEIDISYSQHGAYCHTSYANLLKSKLIESIRPH